MVHSRIHPVPARVPADSSGRRHLVEVLSGRTVALHIPELFRPEECGPIMEEMSADIFVPYDERLVQPRVTKIGPALNEFCSGPRLPGRYWAEAEAADARWARSAVAGEARARALAWLADSWGGPLRRMSSRGRRLYAGIVREAPGGLLVHYDDVTLECPAGLLDVVPVGQAALNVYLSMPADGGETLIWPDGRAPGPEEHREGYGYRDDVVAGLPRVIARPRPGDALLFDSRRLHAVAAGRGGRRVTLSFCLGMDAAGDLVVWS